MDDMAHVILRAPLSEMCGGRSHALAGTTVIEVLKALETTHPAVAGWILDEQGLIREHINIFVNGERGTEETRVDETDSVHVLPAISGG
jgi:molybdopterin synthase sulfur carrier subunit